MSDPTAELPHLDAPAEPASAPASDLDVAIASVEAEAAPPSADALRAFTAMQYALLEEVRRLLDETGAQSREILDAIFDPGPIRSSETELERVIGALAEDEPESHAASAAQVDSRADSRPDAQRGSLEELEAALLATHRERGEKPLPPHVEAAPNDVAVPPETTPVVSLPMRVLDRAAAPLRALAAPLRSLPPSYRPIVGVFALTLFLWYPAVRWIAGEAATASRVRPLTAVELDELSAALRPATGASEDAGATGKGDEEETKTKEQEK